MKVIILIWLAAIIYIAWAEREPANAGLPIVKAAWTQPQGRLFAICPNDPRNYPHARESKA